MEIKYKRGSPDSCIPRGPAVTFPSPLLDENTKINISNIFEYFIEKSKNAIF